MSRYALATTVLLSCLGQQPAWGAEDQLILGAGPVYSHGLSTLTPGHGVGLMLDASYGLGELLSLRADAQWSHHPAAGEARSAGISSASLGISGSLDVLVAVPYVNLGVGLLGQSPGPDGQARSPQLGGLLALGAQWRRWPGWALAAELRYHLALNPRQDMPSYFSFALKGQWISEP